MISYVSKDVTYLKEKKMFQNRGKAFQNQQNMFLIVPFRNDQERIPKITEWVLDRSILERFLFLKKRALIFWNAFLSVFFWKIFHWDIPKYDKNLQAHFSIDTYTSQYSTNNALLNLYNYSFKIQTECGTCKSQNCNYLKDKLIENRKFLKWIYCLSIFIMI